MLFRSGPERLFEVRLVRRVATKHQRSLDIRVTRFSHRTDRVGSLVRLCSRGTHRALHTALRSLDPRAGPPAQGGSDSSVEGSRSSCGVVRADTALVRLFARRPLGRGGSLEVLPFPGTELASLDHSGGEFRRRRGGCLVRGSLRSKPRRRADPHSPRGRATKRTSQHSRGLPPRRRVVMHHLSSAHLTGSARSWQRTPGGGVHTRGLVRGFEVRTRLPEWSHPARSLLRDSFTLV